MDFTEEMERAATKFKEVIEDKIDSGVPPPNAPSTIKKKGHDKTLRDTYDFRNSIETRIEPDSFEVGVFDPEIEKYVFINEHGSTTIPPRPVFGPVWDGPGQAILDELEAECADKIEAEILKILD